jgi:hypothetical protein
MENLEERAELDHDTKGVPGLAAIADSIFRKIDTAHVFVADVTPIGKSLAGKWIANPNVLIELGYAKKALGPDRIVLVWNAAFDGTAPEDLPFDLRHRRAPISYTLPVNSSDPERRQVRAALAAEMAEAILASWPTPLPPPVTPPVWRSHFTDDPSLWCDGAKSVSVNDTGGYRASVRILKINEGSRAWARILPATWPNDKIATELEHPYPLGRWTGLDWGRTTGGLIAYAGNTQANGIRTAALWIPDTGEVWGFDTDVLSEWNGESSFSGHAQMANWADFYSKHFQLITAAGGRAPFFARIGVDKLNDARWAQGQNPGGQATEHRFEAQFEFSTIAECKEQLWKAWRQLTDLFGEFAGQKAAFDQKMARMDSA